MGYSAHIVPEHRLAVLRLHGTAGGGDVLAAVEHLLGDPAWEPDFDAVWDTRAVATLDLQPEDLAAIAERLRTMSELRGTGRRALLVRDDLEVDLALLLHRMSRGGVTREARSFQHAEEAAAWLGVPLDTLEGKGDSSVGA